MSQAIVEAVRVNFPTPLGAEHGRCLLAIASALGGGAGLLRKNYGTHVVLPDGTQVSQDIICYPNGRIFDCLADGEGAAVPSWTEAHGSPIADLSRYYAVSAEPVPVPPTPEPVPVPDPNTDVPDSRTPNAPCKAVESMAEVLDALHEMRIEQVERDEAIKTLLHRLINAERMPRRLTGKAGWMSLSGEVDGVEL